MQMSAVAKPHDASQHAGSEAASSSCSKQTCTALTHNMHLWVRSTQPAVNQSKTQPAATAKGPHFVFGC